MAKASTSKYTPAMVATIVAKSEALKAEGRMLDLETATELAALPEFDEAGITARGVVAKIRSLGLEYAKKERTDKTGAPVERKEDTVARISEMLGVDGLDSLVKAEKAALRKLASVLEKVTDLESV